MNGAAAPRRLARHAIAFETIFRKEARRFLRIWPQTLVPPAITMTLYFVIFGNLIGRRIGTMGGHDYLDYIVPGLIMMSVITSAYANVVSSFFGAKFQRFVEELLVAPVPGYVILAGFVAGGMVRAMLVAGLVTGVSLFFTDLRIAHPLVTLSVMLLTAALLAVAGFINALYAKTFDDISIVPTFVLTPLTYLGGVFYSIDLLPAFWQTLSRFNPILYLVNAFRFGMLGDADISLAVAYGMMLLALAIAVGWALWLLNRGFGLRS
ncbi:ABC transporter permease [Candidatus Macondimonas diazotrophica]|jgi:ABC-2 type transport system permease protein|uniref:Transport permease protein n=1 Tax=Candidatus Macondimonas diazotrophica TaxID=2305248 RepID=A0A4Z0F9W3_9GAMM|nr:ABC transporter permease [Candidatus Macondimonas diazotrophica]NCU00354.1 ABC transporter permease [Candidatus Macondimonas diazotrophica]TFZ82682.1 ABC transporter permease [Candidatus Macondimonas diazotrophica]HBG30241.1 ABC transporter permease [Gammaproteobacteria bacterium]HBG50791.1 ABC transporter permease [Gammaproteobacteria bacterium]